jgi:sporulation protein YunB
LYARLLLGVMLLVWVISWLDLHVRPVLQAGVRYECERSANEMFQNALQQQETSEQMYETLYNVSRGADGSIYAVELNAYAVNRLEAALTAQMQQELKTISVSRTLKIPLGVLLNGEMWLGPPIEMHLAPDGYFSVEIYDTLDTAGINQTKLCIGARFTAHLCATLAGFAAAEEIEQEFLLAEIVLNGDVPQGYWNTQK